MKNFPEHLKFEIKKNTIVQLSSGKQRQSNSNEMNTAPIDTLLTTSIITLTRIN